MRPWLAFVLLFGCGDDDGGGGTSVDGPVGGGDGGGGGTVAMAGEDRTVLGGLTVPLDGAGSEGSTFTWSQIAGDPVTIDAADERLAWASIPDVPASTSFTFQLDVGLGDGHATDTVTITVMDASFDDFLADITDDAQLNSSEGIEFLDDALWVVSNGTSFVSQFDPTGAFVRKWPIANGTPVGMNRYPDGRLLLANVDLQRVELLDPSDGAITSLFDALEGGASVGSANYPLPDRDGNVFLSTRTSQTVVRYDAGSGTAREWLSLSGIAMNPNALAFGPEEDMLYVGAVDQVLRVPILASGEAGIPEVYVDGLGGEVDGLVFDEGRNLWIGSPGNTTLFVVPYRATGASAVSRSWPSVGGNICLLYTSPSPRDS